MSTNQPPPDQVPDGAPEPLPLIDPRLIPPEKQDEFIKSAVAKRKKDGNGDADQDAGRRAQVVVEGTVAGGKRELDPVFAKFAAEPTEEERKAFVIGAEKEEKKVPAPPPPPAAHGTGR